MSDITIKNNINGNILFTIDKSISIKEQFLSKLDSNFIPYLQKLVFILDNDITLYSIHDLSTLETDVVYMIVIPLSELEKNLYIDFISKELKKYNPLLPIILKFEDKSLNTDVFDFLDTYVKDTFKHYGNRNTNHVRYILDGTNIELNKYQCKYSACRFKMCNKLETPVIFHVKFYNGPDPDRQLYYTHEINWKNYMLQLLELNNYVLYSITCYGPTLGLSLMLKNASICPTPYNKILWADNQKCWVPKNMVPKFFIQDENIYLGHLEKEVVQNEILSDIEISNITKFFFI
jgi:hypothetical protein